MARTPDLADILNRKALRTSAEIRVALPAEVLKYDAAKQLVDVKPQIREPFEEEDGSLSQLSIPVIADVPVIFPGAGGFRVTFPVQPGDTVLLVFGDRSMDAWQTHGGEQAPTDQRRHHLSDAVAIVGLHPNPKAWTGASTTDMTIGKDGGAQVVVKPTEVHLGGDLAVDAVLKGTTYKSAVETLLTALQTYAGAIQAIADPTSAATIALTAAIAAFTATTANSLSALVKVK